MKKILLSIFFILLVSNIVEAQTFTSSFVVDSGCESTAEIDIYEKISIIGDVYNENKIIKIAPIGTKQFCYNWTSDSNYPAIWDIETKFNGETQNYEKNLEGGIILTTNIIEWKSDNNSNQNISRQTTCFDLNKTKINIIEQNFKTNNRLEKGIYNIFNSQIVKNENPDFWFPFDTRIIREGEKLEGRGLSMKYSGIYEYPVDFEAFDLETAKGFAIQRRGIINEDTSELITEIISETNTEKTIIINESNNPQQPNFIIVGPICATTLKGAEFEIKLKRSEFIFALFWITILLSVVVLALFIFRKIEIDKSFELLLVIFFFQEGISQFSPVVRPLKITLFDLVVPIAILIIIVAEIVLNERKVAKKINNLIRKIMN